MRLSAWRIVQSRHVASAFDGEGARRYGGRWNNPGTVVVYASESLALAQLEMLVHLTSPNIFKAYVAIRIEFDARLAKTVDARHLPKDWLIYPAPYSTRAIGDAWTQKGESAILRVPSAVVPTECNFLINPAHEDFRKISIGKAQALALDPRLLA